jgi:prephenate dehydrogenase
MATVSVGILGLGRVGASVALALRRYNERKDAQHQFEITPADLRAGIREDAAKVGLGDKIERDVFRAAQNRDVVVLALPYADVQAAYKNISPDLRPGAVVLDMSPLKQPSLKWAAAHLSKENHLVGMTPLFNPAYLFDGLDDTLHARADLFDEGNMLLTPSASCVKEAVELASDFATILGSTPHFVDPAEHDSLIAATEGLPGVIGAAAFYLACKNRGWSDAQRFTNPAFGRLTRALHDTHPDDLRDFWLNNRENLVRETDRMLEALTSFRNLLAQNDRAALEAALGEASEAYSAWINRRSSGRWEETPIEIEKPSFGSLLMGGFLGKRLGGKKNGND